MKKLLLLAALCLLGCVDGKPMANRYNSITETMETTVLTTPGPLSAYGTPPTPIAVPQADFNNPTAFTVIGTTYFNIADIPIIKRTGIFCSIGDGLAPNPSIQWTVKLQAVNSLGNVLATLIQFTFYDVAFNAEQEWDFFRQTRDAIALNLVNYPTATSLELDFYMGDTQWALSDYSMDPAWAAAILNFSARVVVEHTFPLKTLP